MAFGEAFEGGDHNHANANTHRINELKKKIVASGKPAVKGLLDLLNHADPWIRYATAASTRDIDPENAFRTLTELRAFPKALGVAAFTTLRMWETGARRS